MPPGPNVSFPSSIDVSARAAVAPEDGVRASGLRLALGAWAGIIYLIYWLGYLGAR